MHVHRVVALVAIAAALATEARRLKKNKPKPEEDDSTPQPSVVTYSTFGFNDVGGYDGFVPSSPDYVNYLSSFNHQDSSTRLYAPAFPTELDTTGFGSNSVRQLDEPYSLGGSQSSIVYSQPNPTFFNPQGFESGGPSHGDSDNNRHDSQDNAPIYGTKLSSKNRNKGLSLYNNTEFNVYSSGFASPIDSTSGSGAQEIRPMIYGESGNNDKGPYNPTQHSEFENYVSPPNQQLKFPKVVDFTKVKQFYPTEVDADKFSRTVLNMSKDNTVTSFQSEVNHNEGTNNNNNNNNNPVNKYFNPNPITRPNYETKVNDDIIEKDEVRPSSFVPQDFPHSFGQSNNNGYKGPKLYDDFKENRYNRPWVMNNNTHDFNFKNPLKTYEYSTDYSNSSMKYDFTNIHNKKPYNNNVEEIVPASSNNIIDFSKPSTQYQFPEKFDYSNFKKIPNYKESFDDDKYSSSFKHEIIHKPADFMEEFKNLYTTLPTVTSQWGNLYTSSDYSTFKKPKRPFQEEDNSDEIVHIPKRHAGYKYKHLEKPTEWSSYNNHKPIKYSNKYADEWTKGAAGTRFKSEEDLLGLRTHDTSHPSYLPTYKPSANAISDEVIDYKKLIEKWRQSYLKSKYKRIKDSPFRDFESFASESNPVHVPVPKPYAIEVPHPVIVPVPQPYPVRVPVPRPVAMPVVHELTVPIEKPVPYPVIKKVPYPVEKLVPVRVDKKVPVPVSKPYPVMVPHVRPVFHHSRPPREEYDSDENDDESYLPRPETAKRIPYTKRPRGNRQWPRRPTRGHYDRNRRRWPARPPTYSRDYRREENRRETPLHRRPTSLDFERNSYRHTADNEDLEVINEYLRNCKRRGNC